MSASIKNILIGLFVLFAVGIIVFMLLFLHPSVGDNAKTLRVRFTDIDKVNTGTRVTYAGRPVGEVMSIHEIPEARTSRLNQNGEVYVYELILKVDSAVDVYNTDNISLRTSGLLGERNIEIDPQPLKQGEKLVRVEDNIIFASSTSSMESTLKQFEELSNKFGTVLDDFHRMMLSIEEHKIVNNISHSVDNVVEITDSLNQPAVWKTTLDNMIAFSEHINRSMTTVDDSLRNIYRITDKANTEWSSSFDQTLQEFNKTATNARIFSEKADELMENTRSGNGTVGQLLVGNDLYLRLKSLLFKGSTIMDDMSTYGILYHLDKKWQRVRANRMRLLQRLSSPAEFERYFASEMDRITTSLSRVTLLLNDSDSYPQSLMDNPCFTQRFGDLLQKVEVMEEALKMYNEQVVDQN